MSDSSTVLHSLAAAGWFAGRRIDTSEFEDALTKEGFMPPEPVRELLREFGGLEFRYLNGRNGSPHSILVAPPTALDLFPMDWASHYSERAQTTLIPIGVTDSSHMIVVADPRGAICAAFERSLIRLGDSLKDSLEREISGSEIERVP